MTLYQPPQVKPLFHTTKPSPIKLLEPTETNSNKSPILCHKCGAPITFSKDHVGPSGRKVPLQPNTKGQPHAKYCMYADIGDRAQETDALMQDFLSLVPNTKKQEKRILFAVGKAKAKE